MRILIAAILVAGCAGTAGGMRNESAARPEPAANDEVMRDDTPAQHGALLSVSLDATPEIHLGSEGQELDLTVRITNTGDAPIEAEDLAAELRIDNHSGPRLQLSGHGWDTLAPGESAEWHERDFGVRLFEESDEHTLQLEVGDAISAPVRVLVSE